DAAPDALRTEFAAFRARHPELEAHARFEALHAQQFGADPARWHWRSWPAELRDPHGAAVAAFAGEHAREVDFYLFLQFVAERQLAAAQAEARRAGMRIGLISDLAVGSDSGGSQSWSRQDEMLVGLGIGAPPDLLNTRGQNWGVVAFSPTGLRRHGYGAFIDMLRAALRHTGGVRIDHAMGLRRLWVVPEGSDPRDGAYLRFPLDDLLRLLALESQRHHGIVLGEDLGTVPEGFQDQLAARGILGMRVLWFERDGDAFRPPAAWWGAASAMTSTHDLPTVAGWWRGRDLEWRRDLGLLGDEPAVRAEYEARGRDRALLWHAMQASGAATGDVPPAEQPMAAVDAAARHVGRAASELVMLPLEDALAESEQPNLPGTLHEHPNWRRRTPGAVDHLLDSPEVAARLAGIAQARAP
ncbi:MAG: 4-alpha-glucanotransferase, partial [Alphaproteobacteria bacterium]|nr:4-alpha-glucanotransferase [Alphaproteobacteria bacterium]